MRSSDEPRPWLEINSGVIRDAIPPELLGSATITPEGRHEAGSFASFTLTYTAGKYGIDDSGGLRVCFRAVSDQAAPQFDDPEGPGYCTIVASNNAVLQCSWEVKGNVRPWDNTLRIKVVRGYLSEGDTITVRFGVTDHGGPGMRLQTFCEGTFEFRVLVDPIATYNFQTLPEQPVISIVPGPPVRQVAVIPTLRRPGDVFSLRIKGEDAWGNPSDQCDTTFVLEADGPIDGLPKEVRMTPGDRAIAIDGLSVAQPGVVSVRLIDPEGNTVVRSNSMVVRESAHVQYWGDLHGQSEETIGTGTAEQYFSFARDLGFLDACAHQGNDFQITDAFWKWLNELTRRFDKAGEFVALPGYEWSGNTALGGDRNVYFPIEGRTIRRSSRALVDDGDHAGTDAPTCRDLFDALAANEEWDVVMYAHCGGRYADIAVAHDGRFERSVEVHSAWGSFEWLLHDAFRLKHRVGVVGNSDGHKCRPGASYPGADSFGAIGGLTCFLSDRLDRSSLLDCMRKRHHYATSGGPTGRMSIELAGRFTALGRRYHDDPAVFAGAEHEVATDAMMGDIVHLPEGEMDLDIAIETAAPIDRLDIFNGMELVETITPFETTGGDKRIRILWEGATYRGRAREVVWDGHVEIDGNHVESVTPINFHNPERTVERSGNAISWRSITTGNFSGIDVVLRDSDSGILKFDSPLIGFEQRIADIGEGDIIHQLQGELPRFVKIFRRPASNPHRSLKLSRRVYLHPDRDNPVFVRLTQDDGTRAWTSPIYVFRK